MQTKFVKLVDITYRYGEKEKVNCEWGRGSFEKCDENLKLGWKHLSPHSNCPELSQLQMKCSTYQAKLGLIYSRKGTSFATVQ